MAPEGDAKARRLIPGAGTFAGLQAVCAGLLLLVYALTASRAVMLGDDGIFIMAASTLGSAHPPGYPLHSLLGWLFTFLPISTVEWRVHFLSACLCALTCSVLWLLVRKLTRSSIGAWAAALGLGLSGVFWSQSIGAKSVYTLNTFLFASAWLAMAAYRESGSRRHLDLAALACGLGLANHWPLFLLSAPGLLLTALPRWRQWPRHALTALPVGFAAAALPYLWLYWRSHMHPAFSFLGPLEGWGDLWGMIQRRMYSGVTSVSATHRDLLSMAGFFGREMCAQFTPAGVVLVLLGLAFACRRWKRTLWAGLLAAWFGGGLLLLVILRLDYEYLYWIAFRVYPLIPYMAMALLIGVAIAAIGARGSGARSRLLALALTLLLAAGLWWQNADANNQSRYTWGRDYASLVLNLCETNAVLFLRGDLDASPIGEMQVVRGVRRDVTLIQIDGCGLSANLYSPLRTTAAQRAVVRETFVHTCGRPVYYTDSAPAPGSAVDSGLVKKWLPADQSSSVSITQPMLELVMRAATNQTTDPWTIYHQQRILSAFGGLLTRTLYHVDEPSRAQLRPYQEAVCQTWFGRLGMLGVAETVTREKPEDLLRWMVQLEQAGGDLASKEDRSILHRCRARLYRHLGNEPDAIAELWKCLDAYPCPQNGDAAQELATLLWQRKDRDGVHEMTRRYGSWFKLVEHKSAPNEG